MFVFVFLFYFGTPFMLKRINLQAHSNKKKYIMFNILISPNKPKYSNLYLLIYHEEISSKVYENLGRFIINSYTL